MPEISVIIPVYKVEQYLHRCLESLAGQSFSDLEFICVDDGSPDNCGKILDEYAAKDPRFKVIHQANGGLAIARNNGLKIAAGKYISFVDSDDFVDPHFLEKLHDAAEKYQADIAAASIIRKRQYSEKYRIHYTGETCVETLPEKIAVCNLPKCCYVWNKLYRRELVIDTLFTPGVYFEDVLWLPEILKKSGRLVTVPNVNYYYWANPQSIVKQVSTQKIIDRANSKRFIIKFFDENGLKLTKRDRMFNKKIISLGPATILKVKEYQNREIFYLFNLLPLFSKQESLQKVVFTIAGIKITCRKNRLPETELLKRNALYESGSGETPAVKNSRETLTALLNSDKSIARYGDGEFNLIFGENLPFQEYSPLLQQRLKEILQSENNSLMVAIPDIFASLEHYRPDVRNFWRKLLVNARSAVYALLKMDKQYFDSEVSRPYMNSADKSGVESFFQNFRKVWENKNIVFVEGEMSRLGVGNDLFSNAASIKRIIAPAKHAFRCYDEILSECKKQAADTLFIIALGPTATVLASDLAQTGFRALDLGHIDIEYEWFRMKAEQKVPVKNKYVNEVKKGRINTELTDTAYLQEIIKVIK